MGSPCYFGWISFQRCWLFADALEDTAGESFQKFLRKFLEEKKACEAVMDAGPDGSPE